MMYIEVVIDGEKGGCARSGDCEGAGARETDLQLANSIIRIGNEEFFHRCRKVNEAVRFHRQEADPKFTSPATIHAPLATAYLPVRRPSPRSHPSVRYLQYLNKPSRSRGSCLTGNPVEFNPRNAVSAFFRANCTLKAAARWHCLLRTDLVGEGRRLRHSVAPSVLCSVARSAQGTR